MLSGFYKQTFGGGQQNFQGVVRGATMAEAESAKQALLLASSRTTCTRAVASGNSPSSSSGAAAPLKAKNAIGRARHCREGRATSQRRDNLDIA